MIAGMYASTKFNNAICQAQTSGYLVEISGKASNGCSDSNFDSAKERDLAVQKGGATPPDGGSTTPNTPITAKEKVIPEL